LNNNRFLKIRQYHMQIIRMTVIMKSTDMIWWKPVLQTWEDKSW